MEVNCFQILLIDVTLATRLDKTSLWPYHTSVFICILVDNIFDTKGNGKFLFANIFLHWIRWQTKVNMEIDPLDRLMNSE